MVKNSLKKLKVPKEEVAPTEKSQDQPDVKLSAKKTKKSKLNGIKAEVNDVAVVVGEDQRRQRRFLDVGVDDGVENQVERRPEVRVDADGLW